MAIPNNLKIGDTYTEESVDGKVFVSKIIGFDDQGRYLSEFVGVVKKEAVEPVEEEPLEEVSFEEIAMEQEEPKPEEKKAAPRKRTPAKRKPATKKK